MGEQDFPGLPHAPFPRYTPSVDPARSFVGLPVETFVAAAPLPDDPSAVAWRVEADPYDGAEFDKRLELFQSTVPAKAVRALVIGATEMVDLSHAREVLIAGAAEWTGLRALYLGDAAFAELRLASVRSWRGRTGGAGVEMIIAGCCGLGHLS